MMAWHKQPELVLCNDDHVSSCVFRLSTVCRFQRTAAIQNMRVCVCVCVNCTICIKECVSGTHRKRMMPVFDMAYDRPRMPLPMMALLRLKTDIPKEVLPSNWKRHKTEILTSKLTQLFINNCVNFEVNISVICMISYCVMLHKRYSRLNFIHLTHVWSTDRLHPSVSLSNSHL